MDIFTAIVTWGLAVILFLGPTILAYCRNHRRAKNILLVNLLFGWTIIGLFVAFTWALSAAEPIDNDKPESATSDYGERFFQNRNIAPLADGGAIVYPAFFSERGYRLGAGELRRYLKMRATETRQVFPRSLIIIILGTSLCLGLRKVLGPEHGTALAVIAFALSFLAFELWFFVRRPKAEFREAFPRAPQAQDPERGRRKLISALLAFNLLISASASILCAGLIASIAASAVHSPGPLTVPAHDGAVLLVIILLAGAGAAYFGLLTMQHLGFLARHRRSPVPSDLDALAGVDAGFQETPGPEPVAGTIV